MTVAAPPSAASRLDPTASVVLLLCCAAWGLQQVSIKLAGDGISPLLQGGLRSMLALGCVLVFAHVRGIRLYDRDGSLAAGIGCGLLFAAEFVCIYVGLAYTTAARSVVMIYTAPFFVALGCHFLVPGERIRRAQVLGLACAFAGIPAAFADIVALPTRTQLLGDALALGGAVLWAGTTIVIKRTSLLRVPAAKALAYQLGVSAVVLPLAAVLAGEPGITRIDGVILGALVYQGIVVAFVSYLAWFWLITRYQAPRLAAFTFVTPLFGVAAGALVLGEPLEPGLLVSAALVATGIYLVNRPAA